MGSHLRGFLSSSQLSSSSSRKLQLLSSSTSIRWNPSTNSKVFSDLILRFEKREKKKKKKKTERIERHCARAREREEREREREREREEDE